MKNAKLIIAIIFFWLFIGTVAVIVFMADIDKQTTDTTTLFQATVTDVEVKNNVKEITAEVYVKEYTNSLYISTSVCKNINIEDIKNLRNGQAICFRIENTKVPYLNQVAFLDITTLETETKVIFSLDDYNQYVRESAYPARIAGIVFSLLFLSISVFCFYKIKRNRTRNSD